MDIEILIMIGAIVLLCFYFSPKNRNRRKARAAAEQAENAAKQEWADKSIRESEQARLIADHLIKEMFTDTHGSVINLLRNPQVYLELDVKNEGVYFHTHSHNPSEEREIMYDENGNLRPLNKRAFCFIFSDSDMSDLPNEYMIKAFRKYLLKRFNQLGYLKIQSDSGRKRIYYRPQKSVW